MLTRLHRDLTICPNLPIGATVTQFLSRASGLIELIEARRSSQKGKIWSNLYGEHAGYMFQTCKNQNILQMFNAFFLYKKWSVFLFKFVPKFVPKCAICQSWFRYWGYKKSLPDPVIIHITDALYASRPQCVNGPKCHLVLLLFGINILELGYVKICE